MTANCKHNPEFQKMTYLPFLTVGTESEICMCECGALIDFRAEINETKDAGMIAMVPEDVQALILALTFPLFLIYRKL